MKIISFILFIILSFHGLYLVLSPLLSESFSPGVRMISGSINSLPVFKDHGRVQFDFKTEQGVFNCNWYGLHPHYLKPGATWKIKAHLTPWREVKSGQNFNYRWYLLTHGYAGYCSINGMSSANLIEENKNHDWLDAARAYLRADLSTVIRRFEYQGIMLALILGDRSGLSQEDWAIFRNTGTSHLVAISGLHIGLMALVGFWVLWYFLTMSNRLCETCYIPNIALGFSWLIALLYSAMAGFSVPTERALIMISVLVFSQLWGYRFNNYFALTLAAILVILINPWSVFYAGTWLSFMAVFFLIYGYRQYKPEGFWMKLFYPQWVVFIGLLPLSIYWFSQFSTLAFITNCLAIPYMSFIVIPLLMVSVLFVFLPWDFLFLAHGVFYFDNFLINLIWKFLSFASHLPYSHIEIKTPSVFSVIAGTLGAMILLTPRWRWWRLGGVVLMVFLII